jgi:hypothetical protein
MNTQAIDWDIINLEGSIFSKPAIPSIRVFPERELDWEVASLRGGIFDAEATRDCAGQHKVETNAQTHPCLDMLERPEAARRTRRMRVVRAERWLAALMGASIGVAFGGLAIFGIEASLQVPVRATPAAVAPHIQATAKALSIVDRPTDVPDASVDRASEARKEVVEPSRSVAGAWGVAGQEQPRAAQKQRGFQRSAGVPSGINKAAAATAISVAAARAKRCLEPFETRTTMPVRVTFAPSGRVTTAMVVGGPFAGTSVGSCIATWLRTATVGAFDGPGVAVLKTVQIR